MRPSSPKYKECNLNTTSTTEPSQILLENDEWLERPSLWNFRFWHVVLIFFGGFLSVVICVCCCFRIRIPRTKQEIEADYIRKKITKKFKKQLTMINNAEMDEMDLKKALDRVRAEFKSDTESLAQSEAAFSVCSINSNGHPTPNDDRTSCRKPSEIGVDIENLIEEHNRGLGFRIARLVGNMNILRTRKNQRPPKTAV